MIDFIAALECFARRLRLRLIQIALHDAELTGNDNVARRLAPEEARMRAELGGL